MYARCSNSNNNPYHTNAMDCNESKQFDRYIYIMKLTMRIEMHFINLHTKYGQ